MRAGLLTTTVTAVLAGAASHANVVEPPHVGRGAVGATAVLA
ncbi:MAG: hypothetical protein WAO08_04960 [Hyphomicrobiaceae bacterium]